jgi:hypothetical protein
MFIAVKHTDRSAKCMNVELDEFSQTEHIHANITQVKTWTIESKLPAYPSQSLRLLKSSSDSDQID